MSCLCLAPAWACLLLLASYLGTQESITVTGIEGIATQLQVELCCFKYVTRKDTRASALLSKGINIVPLSQD